LGIFAGLFNPHISKTTNFIFSQNSPQAIWQWHYAPTNLAKWQTLRTQNFRAPRISRYSFGDICRPFQPSHLKNHKFHFFKKLRNKPSSYVVVHRQPWPCAKPSEPKTFVHQEFHGIHLGTFVGIFNPHISKSTNFIIFTKLPTKPPMPWCTANLGHVQNPPNSKLSCTKIFKIFIWGHL